MDTCKFTFLSMLVLLGATPVIAQADPFLAKERFCTACHAVNRNMTGPSFRSIAARYAGQGDMQTALARKVVNGGDGSWGANAMPANPQVSEAEAQILVRWVLSQR
jgi:cytochrome c